MTLVVCVEDRWGQAFHRRRLSRDRVLCARVLELAGAGPLWMSPYSLPLFQQLPQAGQVRAGDDYLSVAGADALCFVEREPLDRWLDKADKLVLFRWNRTYPFDLRFPAEKLETDWQLTGTREFSGSSHEKITEEHYEKTYEKTEKA